ncbi:MAG: TRAP transporter small permease subunit [Pseudomonadota bacterium]
MKPPGRLLAWFSLEFLRESIEYEDVLLGDLPAWWFQLVLPAGFALIAYRYVVHTVRHTIGAVRGEAPENARP